MKYDAGSKVQEGLFIDYIEISKSFEMQIFHLQISTNLPYF